MYSFFKSRNRGLVIRCRDTIMHHVNLIQKRQHQNSCFVQINNSTIEHADNHSDINYRKYFFPADLTVMCSFIVFYRRI